MHLQRDWGENRAICDCNQHAVIALLQVGAFVPLIFYTLISMYFNLKRKYEISVVTY